jgi:hypothetical protein
MTDEETKRMADLTRKLADTAIDYKQRWEDIDAAFTNLHREYDRRGDRIEELEAKLATCEKYRAAYAECDRIGAQAVRDLEAKLGKAVEALMAWKHYNESDEEDHVSLMLNYGEAMEKTRTTLAELTGGKDDNNYI